MGADPLEAAKNLERKMKPKTYRAWAFVLRFTEGDNGVEIKPPLARLYVCGPKETLRDVRQLFPNSRRNRFRRVTVTV